MLKSTAAVCPPWSEPQRSRFLLAFEGRHPFDRGEALRVRFILLAVAALVTLLFTPSGLFAYRHPNLGRFMSNDPQEYVDGNNRFEMLRSNPVNGLDPTGTSLGTPLWTGRLLSVPAQ